MTKEKTAQVKGNLVSSVDNVMRDIGMEVRGSPFEISKEVHRP